MADPMPIIPLCMTTAPNGTIYLATFAYWEAEIGVDPNPDFFVVLQGQYLGYTNYPTSIYSVDWSAAAAIERMAVNIFPNNGYNYACAISPDYATFILHVVPTDYAYKSVAQLFSIQVPLGENENEDGFQPIQMVLDERKNRTLWSTISDPYVVVSVQDLVESPSINDTNINSTIVNLPQPNKEWVHFTQMNTGDSLPPSFLYAQTVNGSLPSQATDGPRVSFFPGENSTVYFEIFAIYNQTLYGLYNSNMNQQVLYSIPLRYNTTFEQPAQNSIGAWNILSNMSCTLGSAMTVDNSSVYVYCNEDSGTATLATFNTLTNTTHQVSIQQDLSKVDLTMPSQFQHTQATLRFLDQYTLIYHYSCNDPSLLYFIDIGSGQVVSQWVDGIPFFSSENQNRMLTTNSLTLSSVASVFVTLAALFLGLYLIWIQEAKERKWTRRGVDIRDIPDSKVVDDTDAVNFHDYQRAQQKDLALLEPDILSPSSSPHSAGQVLRMRGNRLGGSSSDIDAVDLSDRSSPFLAAQGLESLQLSNHPRPNVVTTIPGE
ncbi:hypothetical protein EMPS_05238 [Entomortierella parvispora]|uniref:Transmembrane protein n=1 Tax=Entomortierella parvispora TaxID=205924 RepID=A0A9P3LWJ5_9FUNG|nr:hypothetical protein EMPS_05238 [Entomortierella parvispora]